ncbi:efflux RND transporter periplasmic adaptor subunit [Rhizobium sp. FKY42]|uniref:efflux RND transporter periplasmic adaptor subunit n=1 Tax=Rhizobium sp. FKY42 TaxID=2562310 RepID=UPI0010C0D15F|nr:efflux RND transporter periplasmic adaptor subunit [Rhizobium sp. FKY42]
MKSVTKVVLLGLALAGAGLAYAVQHPDMKSVASSWLGKEKKEREGGRDRSIPVVATPAKLADVPIYATGVGTVRPANSVVVRAQVSGRITEIRFQEGQDIKKGEIIARLDDALYRAQLDQAIAKKAQDGALLDNAVVEYERVQRLAGNSAATQQQVDNQRALVAQYKAQVQSDQASIEAAQVQLDYTTIRAPIDGRTGIRNVDVGNIVSSGDSSGIVTLSQIRPITVVFSVPQQELARVNAASSKAPLSVDAFADDGKTVLGQGRLTVVDNQVDATTGTVKLRADFPNENLSLWPGAFVNARLLVETRKDRLTVPSAAVQRGPGGTYSYVVESDDKVRMQAVSVQMQDDRIAVISDGLKAGERVVTTGFARLQDGAQVKVSTPEDADPAKMVVPLSDENRAQRRKGGGNRNNGQNNPPAGEHSGQPGSAPPHPENGNANKGTEAPSEKPSGDGGAVPPKDGAHPGAPKADGQKSADASR